MVVVRLLLCRESPRHRARCGRPSSSCRELIEHHAPTSRVVVHPVMVNDGGEMFFSYSSVSEIRFCKVLFVSMAAERGTVGGDDISFLRGYGPWESPWEVFIPFIRGDPIPTSGHGSYGAVDGNVWNLTSRTITIKVGIRSNPFFAILRSSVLVVGTIMVTSCRFFSVHQERRPRFANNY